MTFSDHILQFNTQLSLGNIRLPEGVRAMNPFEEGKDTSVWKVMEAFYRKFYNDEHRRHVILGINPGRFGAGATGIPFTDTKRMADPCGIVPPEGIRTHEMSSVFVYEVIAAWGEVADFYQHFYISSLCPLGFVKVNEKGREVNYNFYDDKKLETAVTPFIVKTLRQQIAFGLHTDVAFLMGTGKNYHYFKKLNAKENFFDEIVPLEHPRYVMQYKLKTKDHYVEKYVAAFQAALQKTLS